MGLGYFKSKGIGMSTIRVEFVALGIGKDMPSSDDYFITNVVSGHDITATTTETVEASYLTVPAKAGYAILMGMTGNTLVGYGLSPNASNKGKLVREGSDILLVVKQDEKLSFKERA